MGLSHFWGAKKQTPGRRAFRRGKNSKEKTYAASTRTVGRLMRLFDRTIDALGRAQDSDQDAFAVVDDAVGWATLLRARSEVTSLTALAEEDPLVRAADRYMARTNEMRRFDA